MTRIAHLPHRALIRVVGPDWAPFLKGLCTARIDDLSLDADQGPTSGLVYGAFLRPQGKMYADCLLSRQVADDIWLDVPDNAREELLQRLNMYRLRAKVTIEILDHPVYAAFGGPLPAGFVGDSRGDIVGAKFGFSYAPQTPNADAADWTAFRYTHTLAEAGEDFARDELYAIDANLDLLGGIDFHKGCYVGQELTSRMKRRGQIKNRILALRHDGRLDKGAEVLDGERRVGGVLASAPRGSLALIRLDRIGGDLTCNGVPVALDIPAWIAPHLKEPA